MKLITLNLCLEKETMTFHEIFSNRIIVNTIKNYWNLTGNENTFLVT